MRLEISELHAQLKTTMIYVTHDQVEAMTMADKIVVLNRGNIEQVGSPLELYANPRNLFVAGFIGSPKMNFLAGAYAAQHGAATVGVRPEHFTLSTTGGPFAGPRRIRASRLRHLRPREDGHGRVGHRALTRRLPRRPRRHGLADAGGGADAPLRRAGHGDPVERGPLEALPLGDAARESSRANLFDVSQP